MKKLDLIDYSFLNLETEKTPMHVGGLQIFSLPDKAGESFFDGLVSFYAELFQNLEPFNQRLSQPPLGIGLPEWVKDENFSARQHIYIMHIDPPGEQQQLDRLVSRLNKPLLDRNYPLWQIYIIKGLPKRRFALLFKVHHSCIDGIGGIRLLQMILDKPVKGKSEESSNTVVNSKNAVDIAKKKMQRRPRPKGADIGSPINNLEKFYNGLKKEWSSWEELFNSYQSTISAGEELVPQPYKTAPKSIINGKLTSERSFAFRSISLQEMKALRKKAKVTVNDLVMNICAGALRKYMIEKNALPEKSLVGFIPVAVRSKAAGATGNELSFMLVNLATHISDPGQRQQIITASANKGKELLSQMSRTAIKKQASVFSAFGILGDVVQLNNVAIPFNVLISNLPASRDYLYLQGARMEHLHPISFLYETQGLNITILSYEYSMDFGFIACDNLIPDVGHLADLHVEEFETLKQSF
ncbi:MAG: wax ester/triacylglycerol synthase family O-acyltransferase [Spirochaetota bacterium]